MNELFKRTKSGFPLSIGTGLAFETLYEPVEEVYDDSREFERLTDLGIYSLFVFNIETLIRNMISSIPKETNVRSIMPSEFLQTLEEEIDFIATTVALSGGQTRFYYNTYAYVQNAYGGKIGKLRKAKTDKQIHAEMIKDYCTTKLRNDDRVQRFTKDIRYGKNNRVLLLSHVPFDLLSYGNFIKMDLLESHTGKIKSRESWNSKYFPIPGKDMTKMPMMEYLLTTFGDHVMFSPDPVAKRIEVYDSFIKKGVSPLTSELSFSFIMS